MKKYLITGYSGFVSRHFLEYLDKNEPYASITGLDVHEPEFSHSSYKNIRLNFEKIDLLDRDRVESIIFNFQPDYIIHLASYSSVAFSWNDPILSFQNNMNIYLNLLESVRKLNLPARILSIGSSEEYGNVDEKTLPLTEAHVPKPVSPYAVARVSQEMISKVYVDGYGLDIVMTRSFNHIGPFQRDIFVLSSFAKQLVEIKKSGKNSGELFTGDTSIVRDFTDVRDVVAAYDLLLKKGKTGEIYNVCSGKGTSLNDIIGMMAKILDLTIHTRVNEKLVRPDDNRIIIGSKEKIKREVGWDTTISLDQSLADITKSWCEAYVQ
ncbi:MAG: GDP-mannose 4,6-dehydratase [Syntrophales bacterium]